MYSNRIFEFRFKSMRKRDIEHEILSLRGFEIDPNTRLIKTLKRYIKEALKYDVVSQLIFQNCRLGSVGQTSKVQISFR